MQSAKCKTNVFASQMIEIIAVGDTSVLRFAFCVLRFYRSNGTINWNLMIPFIFHMPGADHRGFGVCQLPAIRFFLVLFHKNLLVFSYSVLFVGFYALHRAGVVIILLRTQLLRVQQFCRRWSFAIQ
jgi:hypothetical protein